MSLVTTCCYSNQCNMAACIFCRILPVQNKFISRPILFLRWSYVLHNYADILPTLVAPPVFDDNSPSAACLFLSLGHTLTSFIIRVICSVDCHLLLNHPEAWQLLSSTGKKRRTAVGPRLLLHAISLISKMCECYFVIRPRKGCHKFTWFISLYAYKDGKWQEEQIE